MQEKIYTKKTYQLALVNPTLMSSILKEYIIIQLLWHSDTYLLSVICITQLQNTTDTSDEHHGDTLNTGQDNVILHLVLSSTDYKKLLVPLDS